MKYRIEILESNLHTSTVGWIIVLFCFVVFMLRSYCWYTPELEHTSKLCLRSLKYNTSIALHRKYIYFKRWTTILAASCCHMWYFFLFKLIRLQSMTCAKLFNLQKTANKHFTINPPTRLPFIAIACVCLIQKFISTNQ